MKRTALVVSAVLALAGTVHQVQASPAAPARFAAATSVVGLEDTMRLWRGDKQEEALASFMAVDFARRPLFAQGSTLALSEKEYAALPRPEIDKLQPKLLEDVRVLKEFAGYVKESAAAATQRGDPKRAEQYLAQLKQCGQALNHPDSLALLQLVGKAVVRLASGTPASTPKPR